MLTRFGCLWLCLGFATTPLSFALSLEEWNPSIAVKLSDFMTRFETKPVVIVNAEGVLWPSNVLKRWISFLENQKEIKKKLTKTNSEILERPLLEVFESTCGILSTPCLTWMANLFEGHQERLVFQWARRFWNETFVNIHISAIKTLLKHLPRDRFAVWALSMSPKWLAEIGALQYGIRPERVISVHPMTRRKKITRRLRYRVPFGLNKAYLVNRLIQKRPMIVIGHNSDDFAVLTLATDIQLVINPPRDETNPNNLPFITLTQALGWMIQRF